VVTHMQSKDPMHSNICLCENMGHAFLYKRHKFNRLSKFDRKLGCSRLPLELLHDYIIFTNPGSNEIDQSTLELNSLFFFWTYMASR